MKTTCVTCLLKVFDTCKTRVKNLELIPTVELAAYRKSKYEPQTDVHANNAGKAKQPKRKKKSGKMNILVNP